MIAPAPNREITLGVDLSTNRGSLRITFQPGDERAFVVGGSPHADLRLQSPGVGGVAFHLERRQDHMELFPADTTRELLVDGCRVLGPVVLEPTAVVDLPGERLVLTTFDATGLEAATSVRLAEAGIAYVAALPAENATTLLGVESESPESDDAIYEMKTTAFVPPHAADIHEKQTTAFAPMRSPDLDRTVSFDGRRTDRLPFSNLGRTLPLGPTGTEVVRRSDLAPPAAPEPPPQLVTDKIPRGALYAPPPAATSSSVAPPIVPAPVLVPRAVSSPPPAVAVPAPPSLQPESCGPATTRFDHPVPHPAAPPPVAPSGAIGTETTQLDARRLGLEMHGPAPQRSSPPPSTWASDNPTIMSSPPRGQRLRFALRRLGRALRDGSRKGPGELVVALGVQARRRPVAVSAGAIAVACALALALSGGARLAGYGKARPSRPAAAATTNPTPAPAIPPAPTPSVVPSMVIHLPPPAPALAASAQAKPRPRGVPFDPEVATAAGDLAAGRDAQARADYTRLAARSPDNPAYESLATLLARAASPECEKATPGTAAACPEVKR